MSDLSQYRITNVDLENHMQIYGIFSLHQLETIVKHIPSVRVCSAFVGDHKYRSCYLVYPKSDHDKMITILSVWLSITKVPTALLSI